ncbi:MarR family winged helix-turn-helix transcriptional regulator [Leucobacter soli]|uniref:HTH marR-type domain-containing protein n=1 Tax=Leucobacter soli TaxID=2812850 RepID=A0A916NI23_9MICO|nr:MarR family transcriptional regulator [Leucobacter soli]CAG7617940.1 hypothetical protein LEUCIP111803_02155 [Leucobacter soli]
MEITVLDRLLAIGAMLDHDMQRAFAGTALTPTRVHALWVLIGTGPATQQRLSEELGTTPRSVSALVDGLAAAGYVERRAHPEDGRAVLVSLTPAAAAMMGRMREDHRRLTDDLIGAVDASDRAAFERGLSAVMERLDELIESESASYADVETENGGTQAEHGRR